MSQILNVVETITRQMECITLWRRESGGNVNKV